MKFSLSISLIAIAMFASAQTASAQEGGRGARFNFAPNVFKNEGARIPKGYGDYADPHHNVHAGAVPSKNLLGLDPMMLSKPAPVAQQVAPAARSVTAQMTAPKTNSNFSPLFGRPMQVAQLPPAMPQMAIPQAMPSIPKSNMAVPQRHAPANHAQSGRRSTSQGVSGRLMRPTLRHIAPQMGTPAVASYGNHFGYEPGAYVPTSSGGGNARAEVRGTLLRH